MNALPELKQKLSRLKHGDHICTIYENLAEQMAVAVPFVMDGLARGERCLYIVDDRTVDEVVEALEAAGVDTAQERQRGALWLLNRKDTCLRVGEFAPQEMIDFIRQAEAEALSDGFTGLRQIGEMTWLLGPEPGCDRLIEFEALVNPLLENSKTVGLCQYNQTRFDAPCILDVVRTHPLAILGDQLCTNPYYEIPELVLRNDQAGTTSDFKAKAKRVEWWIAQLKRARKAEQERERVLEKLKQSERRLKEAQQVAHIGSWERDLRTDQVTWSDELYHIFGLTPGEIDLSYQQFLSLLVPEDVDRIQALVDEAIRERRHFNFDYRITLADGSIRVLNDRGGTILNEEGAPIRLVGTAQDVTERRQTERELQESHNLLRAVIEGVPEMLFVKDRQGRYLVVNSETAHFVGRPAEDILGRDDTALFDPETARRFMDVDRRVIETRRAETYEKSGTALPNHTYHTTKTPFWGPDDEVRGVLGISRDITKQKQAEQALQENAGRLQTLSRRLLEVQEEERRHLARELHDEIGQMLTSLRLILKPSAELNTNAAKAGFEKARALVDELLETVRQLSFDLRPAALDQLGLLPGLLALFERYTKQTGVVVNFKHQGVNGRFAPEVETTVYRIVQEALTNVARHAAVANVSVRVWAAAGMLSAQIEDRGRGFDAEDALARLRSSGLPGMQERVTLLGGRLTIESRPGTGTQITAELPLHGSDPQRGETGR